MRMAASGSFWVPDVALHSVNRKNPNRVLNAIESLFSFVCLSMAHERIGAWLDTYAAVDVKDVVLDELSSLL